MKIIADEAVVRAMRVALRDHGDQSGRAGRRPFLVISARRAVLLCLVAAGDAAVKMLCRFKKGGVDPADRGVARGQSGAPAASAQPRGQPFRRILPAKAHLGVSPGHSNQAVT